MRLEIAIELFPDQFECLWSHTGFHERRETPDDS